MKEKKTSGVDSATKRSKISAMVLDKFRSLTSGFQTLRTVSSQAGGDTQSKKMAKEAVYDLVEKGVVEQVGEGKYKLKGATNQEYTGVVDMLSSGSMYVKVEELEGDIFVNYKSSHNALHNDTVRARITSKRRDGSLEGEITEVVERSAKNYVGVLELSRNFAFVRVDSRKVPMDIFVPLRTDIEMRDNLKVLIHITDWAIGSKSPIGEIVKVLGQAGDNDTEMNAIMAEYDLPYEFEKDVVEAAERISEKITKHDISERRDMRDVPTFTIDPADAKDFDDALSCRRLPNGHWEIGVHIADVTHYVRPGSIVDTEAESRATSVYLVDRTVSMLPEKLSNNLCSLRPNEEKLCFSAIFELDENAVVQAQWLGRTVILSDRRFSYEEAQSVIESGEGDYKTEVLAMHTLAQIMRAERYRNGSISFEREEAKFTLDDAGKPLGVHFKVQKESNQLIEEFMLKANCTVAEFIGKKRGAGANAERTFVYRVHDEPNTEKLERFRNFILKFGYVIKIDQMKDVSKQMNMLMGQIKGKSEEVLVSTLAIRTMAKAYYTTNNIGHYGLGFPFYTHFTSPIRRFPDMMVHRLLAHYLDGGKSADQGAVEAQCEHSSAMEVRAAEAERASIRYKMVEFMLERIGQQFAGHISGVTEWGLYVELDETHIEGMVALREMTNDYYTFNADDYAVVGSSSGKVYTLGDPVTIRVVRADLARKQLDFEMADMTSSGGSGGGGGRSPRPSGAGGPGSFNGGGAKKSSRGRSRGKGGDKAGDKGKGGEKSVAQEKPSASAGKIDSGGKLDIGKSSHRRRR